MQAEGGNFWEFMFIDSKWKQMELHRFAVGMNTSSFGMTLSDSYIFASLFRPTFPYVYFV